MGQTENLSGLNLRPPQPARRTKLAHLLYCLSRQGIITVALLTVPDGLLVELDTLLAWLPKDAGAPSLPLPTGNESCQMAAG